MTRTAKKIAPKTTKAAVKAEEISAEKIEASVTKAQPASTEVATVPAKAEVLEFGSFAAPGDEYVPPADEKIEIPSIELKPRSQRRKKKAEGPVELGFEGMQARSSESVMVQPRTLGIAKPHTFYFEPLNKKRDDDKGNSHDQKIVGVHQVDPNRRVSCAPVMPNLDMWVDTGNPYPTDETHPSVNSTATWSPYVEASNIAWSVLSTAAEPMTGDEILKAVTGITRIGVNADGTAKNNLVKAVRDTLRDLRCYGLAKSEPFAKNFLAKKWAIVDPHSVPFTSKK